MRNTQVTQTINSTTSTYAASTCLGGLQTIVALESPPFPGGILDSLMLISKAGNTVAATAYVFNANPTNSVFRDLLPIALSPLDVGKLAIQPVVLTPATSQGATPSVAAFTLANSIQNGDTPATSNLYVAIVPNGSITPNSATDFMLSLGIALD